MRVVELTEPKVVAVVIMGLSLSWHNQLGFRKMAQVWAGSHLIFDLSHTSNLVTVKAKVCQNCKLCFGTGPRTTRNLTVGTFSYFRVFFTGHFFFNIDFAQYVFEMELNMLKMNPICDCPVYNDLRENLFETLNDKIQINLSSLLTIFKLSLF